MIHKHSDSVFWFDLMPRGEKKFISVYMIVDEKVALIETGPASSNSNLLEGIEAMGLSLGDINYVIPTHIHLDHFGGGGHIMDLCQNAKAVVHPKAYTHVSAVERWWEGSRDFLGGIAELYGKPRPISESRLISADDGYTLSLGQSSLSALHTPGHAPHHITWIYGDEAFVGDSAGLWYSNLNVSFPVTPGYYRHDLALDSIDRMSSLDLKFLHYTHFGPRLAEGALDQVKSEFEFWMGTVTEGYEKALSSEEIVEILFGARSGLEQTDMSHGIHQTATHLGSVEGMLNWLRRKDA
ncbi:MAG: MBL fold metallo-hydrolase [Candidatus Thermoplasmatota archaeon]|nr:MBL fold metallo-hydrolase [Candidatus Thermoplasmatota archaeon]